MPGALPPRQFVATSAGRLEFVRSGRGRPTWLLFNGAGIGLEGWQGLYPAIEQFGTVFAWNRFGLGRSDPPRAAQTGDGVVAVLREALAALSLEPPYVLVGHSLGGLHAHLFARRYPEQVAGVALLEATHPEEQDHGRGHESRLVQVLDRLFPLPKVRFRANLEAELRWQAETAREVRQAPPFPPVPLVVVTGAQAPPRWLADAQAVERRRLHQRELARLSPQGEQVMAWRSGHFPQRTEPQCVLRALRSLAARVGAQKP
ncbi:alpha/beta fold hydrolase [Ramlibacter rhizophilus]|uniref:Alpha/beta hydrolase n=1 Tax=Ramlibacter rhizophilus TaxID=1781167 RepID=A0A4Z0BXU9_9BURK|nr:alpha/beta hydrolase [Ramlibacter rhizophilus]TFZ03344.1 alpha/beta hydrolase [Ramlibacter rhizophilus]